MNSLARNLVLAAAIAVTTIAAVSPASARDPYRYPYERHHRHHNNDVAIGAAGLAAGVLLGTAIASQPRYVEPAPIYVEPGPVYVERDPIYVEPAPVYRERVYVRPAPEYYPERPVTVVRDGGLRPWSSAWYQYCAQRYRSFNAKTGTYVGYDGQRHFCSAS